MRLEPVLEGYQLELRELDNRAALRACAGVLPYRVSAVRASPPKNIPPVFIYPHFYHNGKFNINISKATMDAAAKPRASSSFQPSLTG